MEPLVDAHHPWLLTGDLGGTKAALAIVSPAAGPRAPLAEAVFPSHGYPSFAAIVREFLTQVNLPVSRACFDVAGPVVDGRAALSNLPWVLDEVDLTKSLGLASVRLLNDLEALAYAIPHLQPEDLVTLNPGIPVRTGALAVIAPGTGLGEAYLVWTGSAYRAFASEGGHTDFAPADDVQVELLQFMRSRFDHVSYERVCSGLGIANLYDFLRQTGRYPVETLALAASMAASVDRTPLIVAAAVHSPASSPLCAATLDLFVSILGDKAGNLALTILSTGGVYLGGGIPPRIQSLLCNDRFMQSFRRKGRFAEVLGRMPVHMVINARAPLLGAGYCALTAD